MDIKILMNKNFLYKVKKDETLNDIATQFKTSETILINCNKLADNELEEGDILYIENENNFIYTVKPLDNLDKIAKKHNVSVDLIKSKNKLLTDNVFIGQVLII